MSEPCRVEHAIAEAQRFLAELKPPKTEADTCDWVIKPILYELGYERFEVTAQSADAANKFPDFTILPETRATWYLEAKAWATVLDSAHVDQALNYAHSNGRRWVVLSNGREWRLYDDTIHGVSSDRLVASARLEDTAGMKRFLQALTKESMLRDGVAVFAEERRVREWLARSLADPDSAIIRSIVKHLRRELGGIVVSPQSVVEVLNSIGASSSENVSEPELWQDPIHGTSLVGIERVYRCEGPDAHANGRFTGRGMVVLAGSRVRRELVNSVPLATKKLREDLFHERILVVDGSSCVLGRDVTFDSPSAAACFVLGRSANGWSEWRDLNGEPLDMLRQDRERFKRKRRIHNAEVRRS
jgi:predicted type IV restriction endonuclease